MSILESEILAKAAVRSEAGERFALAVVTDTWGSSPRARGSLMMISEDGQIDGSVSGGCVEASVIEAGMKLMAQGRGAEQLDFGVADETAWEVGLSCGGSISVWVCSSSSISQGLLASAADKIATRQSVFITCDIASARMTDGEAGPQNQLNDDKSCFQLAVLPRPRLVIIGAVHISQHLAPMARATGFDVTIIDPRDTFATQARFPEQTIINDWPQDALKDIIFDRDTALVTLTHDPKIDDEALRIILPQPAFYLSCLGSRKTHNARIHRLKQDGFTDLQLDRIHGPAGLDIGARTPAEIAISVLAELISAYRGRQDEN